MTLITLPPNVTPGGQILDTDERTVYNVINGNLDSTNITPGSLAGTSVAASTISYTKLKSASGSVGVATDGTHHFNGANLPLPTGLAPGITTLFFPGISTDNATGTRVSIGGNVLTDGAAEFNVANVLGAAYVLQNTTPQFLVWLAVLNPASAAIHQGNATAYYLQASPPYDLGDGEIPLFVFALINPDGQPILTFVAPDPPWGSPYVLKPKMPSTLDEALSDPAKMQAYLAALDLHVANRKGLAKMKDRLLKEPDLAMRSEVSKSVASLSASIYEPAPDTQEYKNRLMPSVPHPFMHNDIVNGWGFNKGPLTPVMLDPMDPNTERLALLHESGENVNALIHSKQIVLGDTHLSKRKGPPGVKIVSHSFKNSGGR
jgi:hypothetical protein